MRSGSCGGRSLSALSFLGRLCFSQVRISLRNASSSLEYASSTSVPPCSLITALPETLELRQVRCWRRRRGAPPFCLLPLPLSGGGNKLPTKSLQVIQPLSVLADDLLLGPFREWRAGFFHLVHHAREGAVKVRVV